MSHNIAKPSRSALRTRMLHVDKNEKQFIIRKIDMNTMINDDPRAGSLVAKVSVVRGAGWGLIAGLVGTLLMDLVLMGALSAAGLPPYTCFTLVGDTVALFFSKLGIGTAGGVPVGVAAHYVVGPLLGAMYGGAVMRIKAFKVDTIQKAVLCAILYAEILSQPILATTPILLKMTAYTTLKWYGGSFVMHFVWGVIAGAVAGYGLKITKRMDPVSPASLHTSINVYTQ